MYRIQSELLLPFWQISNVRNAVGSEWTVPWFRTPAFPWSDDIALSKRVITTGRVFIASNFGKLLFQSSP